MSMVFALVLMGCADDGSACERLAAQPRSYETKAACQADQETALESDVALRADYPAVVSRCVRTAVAAAERARSSAKAASLR
jgi:hypothetical protein